MTTNIAHLDVPAAQVAAEMAALNAKRTLAGCLAEQSHQLDTTDAAFAALACAHGDCCSTDADYPGWTPPHQEDKR